MSTTQASAIRSPAEGQDLASVHMKFEVMPIPVTDLDRSKAIHQRLGWRLDTDYDFTEQVRALQFTPPRSAASIHFAPAGAERIKNLLLIVDDVEAARDELVGRGIVVSDHLPCPSGRDAGAGTRSRGPRLRESGRVLGPRRERVGPPGGHRAHPGAGVAR